MAIAPWLETDEEFEGVGAHYLNPRYDPVDENEDHLLSRGLMLAPKLMSVIEAGVANVPFQGHDGSHYQWDQGRAAGRNPPVDLFALAQVSKILWWKASQSTGYADPTFAKVWASASTLFEYRLAYHWLSSTTDPEKQAAHLCAILDALGGPREGDAIMIDAEENGVNVEKCDAFAVYCERHYDRPIISGYFGLYVDGGRLWNSEQIREGNYGHRPMHVAAYVLEDRLNQLMAQRQAKPYDAWQYWSGGPVPGVTGRADMNTHINFAAYNLICKKQKSKPVIIVPDPEPLPVGPPISGEDMSVLDSPVRVWDSRAGSNQGGNGKHDTGEVFLVNITNWTAPPANARGVIVSLHVLEAEAAGYLTVWGAGGRPGTSNVNFAPGETKDSLAVVPMSGGGINTFTSARCNVIVDVQGWVT